MPESIIYHEHMKKSFSYLPLALALMGGMAACQRSGDAIRLEPLGDSLTVVRVDKPNAGWDGETVIREYEWFLNNGVIHLTAVDSEKAAYGVGLETEQLDRIFVDFGEECSVFNGSAIAE